MNRTSVNALSQTSSAVTLQGRASPISFAAGQTMQWQANKIAGSHKGTVPLTSGSLDLNGTTEKGRFIFDLKALQNSDLSGEWKDMLETHLKSPDFFHVEAYPEALFVIQTITPDGHDETLHTISGVLTIKGITKPLNFSASIQEKGSDTIISAKLSLNRLDWDIRYNSGKFFDPKALGDKLILDELEFAFTLTGA